MTDLPNIYALVSVDPTDEMEGAIVLPLNGINVPMVCQEENINMLKEAGPNVAAGIRQSVRLVRFDRAEVIETYGEDIVVDVPENASGAEPPVVDSDGTEYPWPERH